MKNRKIFFIFAILIFVCAYIACENEIVEKWWAEEGIVIFNANGGAPQPKSVRVAEGVAVGRLRPVTREGFGFVGWFTENGELWDLETRPVTKNDVNSDNILLLTAQWDSSNSFKVDFITDYPAGTIVPSQYVPGGGKAVPPIIPVTDVAPPYKGFAGWYLNDQLWNFDFPITGNITLAAKWDDTYCLVSFEPNGGVRPDGFTELRHKFAVSKNNGIVPDPGPLVKDGDDYYFGGWFTDNISFENQWDFANSRITSSSPDEITLYAKWIPKYRIIIFVQNGGQGLSQTEYKLPIGASLINPGATLRTGYQFRAWYPDPSCKDGTRVDFTRYEVPPPESIADTDPIYFYAGWSGARLYVTFNIAGSGPVTGKVQDQYVDYGERIIRPIITPASGRYLDGNWYTKQNFNPDTDTPWNFDANRITANTDLYARYNNEGWTIKFDLRNPPGGTSGFTTPADQHVLDGGKAIEPFMPPLPAPPLGANETRYSFYRWDYSMDGTGNSASFVPYDFNAPVTGNITLYARWVEPVPDMVWVPRGSFIMGDSGVSGSPAQYHAYPTRRVTLDGFYISRYMITQEDGYPLTQIGTGYNQITNTAPSQFTGTRTRPVENVSWYDAMNYCNTRSLRDGLTAPSYNSSTQTWSGNGYRLPTEAEWEYAARGGYYWQDNFMYAGSNNPDEVAWYNLTVKTQPAGFQSTQTVGLKAPNKLGIYDMSGNLSEWCYDWFASYSNLGAGHFVNPVGASSGTEKVRRGGAWNNAMGNVRVAVRNSEAPTAAHWAVGFRVVRGPRAIW